MERRKSMFISSQSEADSESSDDGSSSSDNESDSSDDELPTEKYASDAYEKSDDDMPSSDSFVRGRSCRRKAW